LWGIWRRCLGRLAEALGEVSVWFKKRRRRFPGLAVVVRAAG